MSRRDWAALERERRAMTSGVDQIRRRAPHFGLTMTSALTWANGAIFDPATLSLTGWWRASFSSSPWAGVASAGSSSGRNLTEATNPPNAGSALNGLTPANFDGSNDRLNGADADVLVSASTGMIAALFRADTAAADAGAALAYNNPALLTPNNGGVYLTYSNSGVRLGGFNGGAVHNSLAVAAAAAAWHLVVATWDATTLYLSVDGGSFSTLAHTINVSAVPTLVGANYAAGVFFDGQIAELMTGQFAANATIRDNLRSYVNARYGLAI